MSGEMEGLAFSSAEHLTLLASHNTHHSTTNRPVTEHPAVRRKRSVEGPSMAPLRIKSWRGGLLILLGALEAAPRVQER